MIPALGSIRVAHTADLTRRDLASARALIFEVFDDATEDDWEHGLGGMHAMLWDGDALIAHGSVIQRRLIYKGRALRTGYVEGVAVRTDHRRHGIGGRVMSELERVIKAAYDLGALAASDEGLPSTLRAVGNMAREELRADAKGRHPYSG